MIIRFAKAPAAPAGTSKLLLSEDGKGLTLQPYGIDAMTIDVCRICGNTEGNERVVVPEIYYRTGEVFEYFSCKKCSCLQIVSIPDSLIAYYPPGYENFVRRSYNVNLGPQVKRSFKQIRTSLRLSRVGAHLYGDMAMWRWLRIMKTKQHHRILDVGCGSGHFLLDLYTNGFDSLLGFDPFAPEPMTLPGLSIVRGAIQDVSGQYDLVVLNHSLEHVPNPLETLRSVRELVSETGWLLIRTPIFPSELWMRYGINWIGLDAPRHLIIHSLTSLALLARDSGFSIEKVEFDSGAFNFWGSEEARTGVALMSSSSHLQVPRLSKTALEHWDQEAAHVNQMDIGDQASIYLRPD